jgi:GH25 family lysozyme M1 (1,4-beta-N-acetylmuramidase)
MSIKSKSFIFLALLLTASYAANVVDLAGVFSDYTCLKQQGYDRAIIRAYHSYGAIDLDAPNNIKLSNAAGLATDVYMFPCRGKNATMQSNQLVDFLNSLKTQTTKSAFEYQTGMIWLDIETNPSAGCSWKIGNATSNCDFIQELIKSLEARGRAVGIYASSYMWNEIFGSKDVCTVFSSYPLWYARYDGKKSFDDYYLNKFGGWTTPTLKQYAGDASVCGYKLDLSWY